MREGRVLVVDDDADTRGMLESLLCQWGYEVVLARNGAEALGLVWAHAADLVLTDLCMPTMDGAELTRRLAVDPNFHHIPIIVVSAEPHLPATLEGCVEAFLQKPLDVERLRAVIRGTRLAPS